MRFWLSLFLLAIMCVIVTYSSLYLDSPVTIGYKTLSIEPPLSLLITTGLLAFIALLIIFRFLEFILFLPSNLMKWGNIRTQDKKTKLLESALCAAVYRDKKQQYKVLSDLAPISPEAALRASQIAQELGWKSQQDKWLNVAAKSTNAITAAAAKVEICRLHNRLTEANSILRTTGAPESSMLLAELLYYVSMDLNDCDTAINAATHLRNAAPTFWSDTVENVFKKKIKNAKNAEEILQFWKNKVSQEDKKHLTHVVLYINALSTLGDEKSAINTLTTAVKQWPNNTPILLLIASIGSEEQCKVALEKNEGRANDDTDILLAIAQIANRLQLTGKARKYYQMLNAINPKVQYQEIIRSLDK